MDDDGGLLMIVVYCKQVEHGLSASQVDIIWLMTKHQVGWSIGHQSVCMCVCAGIQKGVKVVPLESWGAILIWVCTFQPI